MQQAVLVQPPPRGRISGGFLYNARMAEHAAWELIDMPAEQLPELARHVGVSRPVLMDSIWLTEAHLGAFLALGLHGRRVGVMLHSFPSMIAATEAGQAPLMEPSRFEVQALERLGLVVVPGPHYASLLMGCSAKVVIAEPGIDDGWRAEPRRRVGPCRLVSVGSATPRKGFLDVAALLRARASNDYRWTVVGSLDADPVYAERLLRLSHSLPSVSFEGQKPPHEVQRIVRASDVLVMPSYDENQPLVLLEAMAASVPAVAYAAGATRHMLEHGREGLITAIGDEQGLAEHLDRLLDDEDMRYQMALACFHRQSSIPSWPSAAGLARAALHAGWAALEARAGATS
jgi:glycosyltransferase involved in cell wall biosynthesis